MLTDHLKVFVFSKWSPITNHFLITFLLPNIHKFRDLGLVSGTTQPDNISVMEQHIQSTLTFGSPGPYASECATFHTDLWLYLCSTC